MSEKKDIKPKTVKIRRKRQKKNTVWPYAIALIALLGILLLMMNMDTLFNSGSLNQEGDIVATVNNEVILKETIDSQYDLIPEALRSSVSKEAILNKTIQEVLLVQAAREKGIIVSEKEVDEYIASLLASSSMTRDMLDQELAASNTTYDDLKEVYEKQILITRLLNQTVVSKINITPVEIDYYYELNKQGPMITLKEQVRARHILVENLTLAQSILDRVKSAESFSQLAQEYSIDTGSAAAGGDLGYFFEGDMVADFNDAVFSMDVGDSAEIVQTQFGYHIVEVTGKKEGRVKPISEAAEEIEMLLIQEKQEQEILAYIENLRNNAEITVYWDKLSETIPKGVETFMQAGEEVCTEDRKPIIRLYSTSTCPHCRWVGPLFDEVAKESTGIVAYHYELNTGDNLLTEEVETQIPESEMQVYRQGNPGGFVPYFDFGCKYTRVGAGYEAQGDTEKEKQEFIELISSLKEEIN